MEIHDITTIKQNLIKLEENIKNMNMILNSTMSIDIKKIVLKLLYDEINSINTTLGRELNKKLLNKNKVQKEVRE